MAVEVFIEADFSLNPHVVGRFFRGISWFVFRLTNNVLIPMWWGGFSEDAHTGTIEFELQVLIPMWWGGFSEHQLCVYSWFA